VARAHQELIVPLSLITGWSRAKAACPGEACETYCDAVNTDFHEVLDEYYTEQGAPKGPAYGMLRLTLLYECQQTQARGECVLRRTAKLVQPVPSIVEMP